MSGHLLDPIRVADWLTRKRVRGYAVLVGLASIALLVNSYLKAMGPDGTDFLAFWGAGHVTAGGDPAAAYDLAVQQRVQTGTGSEGWFAFVNPPPFLFAVTPFGALPFPLAWIAWVSVTFGLWIWASIRAFPRFWPLVLVFPGALLAAGHAQTGLLTGALLVSGVALLDKRPMLSGALLGALVIKPHLALLIPFWLAGTGKWRAFLAAGASAVGLVLLSWLVFGLDTLLAYAESWQASALLMRSDNPDFYLRMASPYSQLRMILPSGIALAVHLALALGTIALALVAWRRFAGDTLGSGALVLAATAVTSPYLFNYDLPFLILPILWLVREGLRDGFRPYEKVGLVLLYFAPYATRAAALPLGINGMPIAALLLIWLVWTRGTKKAGAR